jgi:hypothetical protein
MFLKYFSIALNTVLQWVESRAKIPKSPKNSEIIQKFQKIPPKNTKQSTVLTTSNFKLELLFQVWTF